MGWNLRGNIKGDTGATGPAGAKGDTGPAGAAGSDGADGPPIFAPYYWSYDDDLTDTDPASGALKFIIDADPFPVTPTTADVTHLEFHHEAHDGVDNDDFWELVLADISASGHSVTLTRLDTGANMTLKLTTKSHQASIERFGCEILTGSFPPDTTDVALCFWPRS